MRERWQHRGALAALALALGYLELFVPLPIPGVRLGLANIPILIALAEGEVSSAYAVAFIKIIASALLFGTPLTALYSAAGTALSCCAMTLASRFRTMRLPLISVIGALAHEAGQLLVAQALLGTSLVWYSAPLLIVCGVPTGLLVGFIAARVLTRIHGYDRLNGSSASPNELLHATQSVRARIAFVLYAGFVVLVLKTVDWRFGLVELLLALALCVYVKLGAKGVWTSLRAFMPVALISIAALYVQHDAHFASSAVLMLTRLMSIALVSSFFTRLCTAQELAGLAGWLLAPVHKLGINTDGWQVALETSLSLLPRLQEKIDGQGAAFTTRAFWQEELPELIAELYCL